MSKNSFGCLVEESIYEHPYVHKKITAPMVPFHMDYSQQETFLRQAAERHTTKRGAPSPTATC